MKPKSLLWLCPGQGQQGQIDLAALRPMPEDPLHSHSLWEGMSEALGEDLGNLWSRLTVQERESNRQAQWGVVLYQVLRGFRLLESGVSRDWLAGYSVGELSAFTLAGSISPSALPDLILTRARLMSEAVDNPDTKPCLVLLSEYLSPKARSERRAALDHWGLVCAIQRSAGESVWGAPPEAVAQFMEAARENGWNARALPVSTPSHTPYLQPVLGAWSQALDQANLKAPQSAVLAGVDGALIRTVEAVKDTLSRQLHTTLEWDETLRLFPEYGVTHVVDLGPGEDQWRLIEQIDPSLIREDV